MAGVISSTILRTQTDERLVALARAGHKRAFEAIAERYRAELTRALRRGLPAGTVEDALQQTLLQAWQALAAGTEVRELRAWLHRIARNAAIAAASRGYDYDELKDALYIAPGADEDLERRDVVRRALRGIAELPERQRDALLAVAVDGRSHAEVGLALGISDTAARQLVRRARVSLLGVMSVAVPPQLVTWAARGGHAAVAGGSASAGKAAAGKAAGTGLGGSLGGSALKVGVIAVTVGGVAVSVPPIRHAIVPPAPSHAAHHRHASTPAPVYVATAVQTPLPSTASSRASAAAAHSAARAARRAARLTTGGSTSTTPVATTPAAPPVVPATPPPAAATPTQTAAAATSSNASAAALLAWWLAHQAHHTSTTAQTTTTSTRWSGQDASAATGRPGVGAAGCATTPAAGTSTSADPTTAAASGATGPAGAGTGSSGSGATGASGYLGGGSATAQQTPGGGRTAWQLGGRRSPSTTGGAGSSSPCPTTRAVTVAAGAGGDSTSAPAAGG